MRIPGPRASLKTCALLLFLIPSVHLLADSKAVLSGSDLVLQDNVVDLRANAQMRAAAGKSIGGYPSVADLQVGSIFISPDNSARRVVGITTDRNTTVIQTDTPPVQDVVAAYYMPDQTVSLTSADIIPGSVRPGVTILPSSGVSKAVAISRSLAQGPTWLGTDTSSAVQGGTIIKVGLDVPIQNGGKQASVTCSYGCLSAGVNGQVRLKGTLSIVDPQVSAGMKVPSIHVKWVTKHLFGLVRIKIPEFSTVPGYVHASVNSAEQLDAQLTGTENLTATYEEPLFSLEATTGSSSTKVGVTVYLKVTADGQLSVDFSVDEYARLGIWGTTDLAWPFIPHNTRAGADFYYNFASKPTMSARAKIKMGPLVGSDFSILGIKIMHSTMWGGLYSNAAGRVQANDLVGYDENIGGYGSSSAFSYSGSVEVGGFLNFGVDLAAIKMTLVNHTWPFLQLSGGGGSP